jgi:hypothetical protein
MIPAFTFQLITADVSKLTIRRRELGSSFRDSLLDDRLAYLLYYNERDTQIMTPIVDGLIDLFWENKIDMLHNLSLSSCASQAKYALAYKEFHINQDYNPPAQRVFKLTKKSWLNKVENYRQQDEKAPRDTSKNVSKNDYIWACRMFEQGCHMCKCKFDSKDNIPTLDRIDNKIAHTKTSLKPCCQRCNRYKSDKDEGVAKLKIQLHKYAQVKQLLMTLSRNDEQVYWDLIKCKTGGLSIVHSRKNIAGVDTINRLKIRDDGTIHLYKTTN